MRKDIIIWAPKRVPLRNMEAVIEEVCGCKLQRKNAVITPLFHASPKYRKAEALPSRLRLITLENGDFQQINNPDDKNFDEIFAEWPRIVTYFDLEEDASEKQGRQAVLECNDLETNWEKAGWTTGTTWTPPEKGEDRHKYLLGFPPWGWSSYEDLSDYLIRSAEALARISGGQWQQLKDEKGTEKSLRSHFEQSQAKSSDEDDPLAYMRTNDDPGFYGF